MSARLSRREFVAELDQWTDDVRRRALNFFDGGMPAASALQSAMAVAAALALQRHKDRLKRLGDERAAKAAKH